MLPEIVSAIATVKGLSEIASLLIQSKVDNAITEKAIALQSGIISLQNDLMSLQAKNEELMLAKTELEQIIKRFENWKTFSSDYKLNCIADGVFVMESFRDNEPLHWLCVNCFEKKEKSILQYSSRDYDGTRYICPNCKAMICNHADRAVLSYE